MCTYVHAYLLDDSVSVRGPKAFLKVLALGDLPFRDVDEDIGNLEDVIEVCLYTAPVLLHFVLVTCDLDKHQHTRRILNIRLAHLEAFSAFL